MTNPWLDIPLSDYESHILLPSIDQAQMMAAEFSDVLLQYSLESVAVIVSLSSNQAKRSTFRSIARRCWRCMNRNCDHVEKVLSGIVKRRYFRYL